MDAFSSGEDGQPDDPGCPSDPLSQSYVQLQHAKYPNRYGERMRDSEVVASIVAGDPEGLAAAYDKYSGPLFGYCQSLLREPDDAADAVQDTFVIAASKLARLRDPERLRAWLFAVARNECLHRLKSRPAAAALHDIPEQPDDSVDVGGEAERAESRALIRAAVGGLNDGERDVINQLWHGLEVPEVATVLGVSRNHAHSLFSRARDQLEASVGGAARRPLRTQGLRRARPAAAWLGRAADRPAAQAGRAAYRPVRGLLGPTAPGAEARAAAVSRARRAARPSRPGRAAVPAAAGRLVATRPAGRGAAPGDRSRRARAVAYRGGRGAGTRSFRLNGFPQPAHGGHLGLVRMPHLPLAAVGGTAAATATAVVLAVVPHGRPHRPAAGRPAGGRSRRRRGADARPPGPTPRRRRWPASRRPRGTGASRARPGRGPPADRERARRPARRPGRHGARAADGGDRRRPAEPTPTAPSVSVTASAPVTRARSACRRPPCR